MAKKVWANIFKYCTVLGDSPSKFYWICLCILLPRYIVGRFKLWRKKHWRSKISLDCPFKLHCWFPIEKTSYNYGSGYGVHLILFCLKILHIAEWKRIQYSGNIFCVTYLINCPKYFSFTFLKEKDSEPDLSENGPRSAKNFWVIQWSNTMQLCTVYWLSHKVKSQQNAAQMRS